MSHHARDVGGTDDAPFSAALGAFAAWALCAASEPPPEAAPYIVDGRFVAGDYGWVRGAFADATPAQKDAYGALTAWVDACRDAALPAVAQEGFQRRY